MAKNFKKLSELYAHIENNLQKALDEVVNKHVIPKLMDAIEKTVYEGYISQAIEPYQRRGADGGLLDPSNIKKSKATWVGDVLTVKVRSIAQPNPKGDARGRWLLDTVIVQGDKYKWKNSAIYWNQPYERDFYEEARKVIEKELPRLMASELKARGINIDYSIRVR